jgi:TPR repeat protein
MTTATDTSAWTIEDAIADRTATRAACDAAWEKSEAAWDRLQSINVRVANGVVYVGNHPEHAEAQTLLANLRRERRGVEADYEEAHARWLEAERVYKIAADHARERFGAPEEEPR